MDNITLSLSMIEKILAVLVFCKLPCPNYFLMVVLENSEPELAYILANLSILSLEKYSFPELSSFSVVFSGLVILAVTWNCYISYKNRFVGWLVLHLLPLLNPWVIVKM